MNKLLNTFIFDKTFYYYFLYAKWYLSHLFKSGTSFYISSWGKYTYGTPKIKFSNSGAKLKIGNFTSIAKDVQIFLGGEHYTNRLSTYPFNIIPKFRPIFQSDTYRYSKGNVEIGNDVWIGDGVTILSGVTIGNGAVIGSKAVVAKNIPDYAIAVGNPCKVIRYRLGEKQIYKALHSKWWNEFDNPMIIKEINDEFLDK